MYKYAQKTATTFSERLIYVQFMLCIQGDKTYVKRMTCRGRPGGLLKVYVQFRSCIQGIGSEDQLPGNAKNMFHMGFLKVQSALKWKDTNQETGAQKVLLQMTVKEIYEISIHSMLHRKQSFISLKKTC